MKLKLAVVGYGNLGKSLEKEITADKNLELTAIYSRRNIDNPLRIPLKDIAKHHDFDVALLALGSYDDINKYADCFTQFDTVDSFDTHAKIGAYKDFLNANKPDKISIISTGWDPGLLSLARGIFYREAYTTATLWGEGVSQGHSNAIRAIAGVIDAVQFTKPKQNAHQLVHDGVTDGKKLHDRICYVACVENDKESIRQQIVNMPNYFEGYDTEVIFCSQQQVRELKQRTAHRGQVISVGKGFLARTEVSLENNADFTARIMLAYAKAIPELREDGYTGALDVYDIPLKYIAPKILI